MSPTYTGGGPRSGAAFVQRYAYARQAGGKAFDGDTGFAVAPGSRVYCPDAAWVSQARIDALTPQQRERFWPLSPDAIEVRSATDRFTDTVVKIATYLERGTQFAVAIDPQTREVVERGTPPPGLALQYDAIVDA